MKILIVSKFELRLSSQYQHNKTALRTRYLLADVKLNRIGVQTKWQLCGNSEALTVTF